MLNIAIIGGGFTGAALAFHLAQRQVPGLNLTVFEPRLQLGTGLAYSTPEEAHRLNARAQRMSLLPGGPTHFVDWLNASGACADDPAALLADGRIFPRRAVYGRYVAAQLAPLLASGAVRHVRQAATQVARSGQFWLVTAESGVRVSADILILATGHPPPAPPGILAAAFAGQPGFIADPNAAAALQKIGPQDRVLIIGTGLTMADVVAALSKQRHAGPILAVSRRGRLARPHAIPDVPPFGDFGTPLPPTALQILVRVRANFGPAAAAGAGWQAVFDALRGQAQSIWQGLPQAERRRLLRHLRPFWDVHRHRLPPQIAPVLAERIAAGSLVIDAATLTHAGMRDGSMRVALRRRGSEISENQVFDAIIVTTGPGPVFDAPGGGALRQLRDTGWIRPDEHQLGIDCDMFSRALDAKGEPSDQVFIAGPLARGTFGDITSAPEIAVQAEAIATRIAAMLR